MISRRDVLTSLAMATAALQFDRRALLAQARATPQPGVPSERPLRVGVELYGKDKLIIRSLRPPDFETPVALLNSFITPNDVFYVRSHIPVPQVDAATWTLKIGGEVNSPITLSLDEIKKLPAVTITNTLECAG